MKSPRRGCAGGGREIGSVSQFGHALVQVQDGVQFLVELLAVGNLIVRGEVGVPVPDLDVAVPQDEGER